VEENAPEKKSMRWDVFTDEEKEKFLDLVVACGGNITEAAEKMGYSRHTVYVHMHKYPEFGKAVSEARDLAKPRVLDEIRSRVFDGIPEPVIYQGEVCLDKSGKPIVIMKKDFQTLRLLAISLYPELFKERFEHSGPDGKPMNVVVYVPSNGRGPKPETEPASPGETPESKTN
jgi:hypothetical protein